MFGSERTQNFIPYCQPSYSSSLAGRKDHKIFSLLFNIIIYSCLDMLRCFGKSRKLCEVTYIACESYIYAFVQTHACMNRCNVDRLRILESNRQKE